MIEKIIEKREAVRLRREGKTYSEILDLVPVARSTLSIWLREIGLAKTQKQRITELRQNSQKKGALQRKTQRIELSKNIFSDAQAEIGAISSRELWLIGVILYWAEGSKQKEWNISQSLQFTNSDPVMVGLYLLWLRKSLQIPEKDIDASLTIHENHKYRLRDVISHWKTVSSLKTEFSDKVYFKRHFAKGYRHNVDENYYGTVRIRVRRSTNLNRKITGWMQGICKYCGVV